MAADENKTFKFFVINIKKIDRTPIKIFLIVLLGTLFSHALEASAAIFEGHLSIINLSLILILQITAEIAHFATQIVI